MKYMKGICMKHKNNLEVNRNITHGLSEDLRDGMQLRELRPFPAEITNFRDLPDEAHIRLPVIKILYGCSTSSIYRAIKSGRIPAPHHFPGMKMSCWQVGKVRAALAKHD
jgi:predicted DNA-binding transcriptional regulator AlpA